MTSYYICPLCDSQHPITEELVEALGYADTSDVPSELVCASCEYQVYGGSKTWDLLLK